MRAPPGEDDRTTVERRDPLVGTILDQRFRIDRQLAAGGFGAIYRATDVRATDARADAEVALKVLHPQMARDPAVVARFRREGATLSNLRNPHTIKAYELGEAPDGTLYIVMELLHGESLYEQFRATGPLPWRRVVHIARGVCSSLAEAHAAARTSTSSRSSTSASPRSCTAASTIAASSRRPAT
jgi:serine/threonine protein kinase